MLQIGWFDWEKLNNRSNVRAVGFDVKQNGGISLLVLSLVIWSDIISLWNYCYVSKTMLISKPFQSPNSTSNAMHFSLALHSLNANCNLNIQIFYVAKTLHFSPIYFHLLIVFEFLNYY